MKKNFFFNLILIMGNDNEIRKIENNHREEIEKIYALKEDNDRKRAIEELAVRNNYNIKKEELENLAEEARNKHQENMKKIHNEHVEKMTEINNNFTLNI